jgi:hypothetical protein
MFCRESNKIEGEISQCENGNFYVCDDRAALFAITRKIVSEQEIKHLHLLCSEEYLGEGEKCCEEWGFGMYKRYLTEDEFKVLMCGNYRTNNVRIGDYRPPKFTDVPSLMKKFCKKLRGMSSYEAHIEFERIHPFADLNGRVGRLLWLSHFFHDRGVVPKSFLQQFYYQTLSHKNV